MPAPAGAAADFAFGHAPADDSENPFDNEGSAGRSESDGPRKSRRLTARKRPSGAFNPFDSDASDEPAALPPTKRPYRKDADYNPFEENPQDEVPDLVGDCLDFGLEAPPPAPASEFDFGPLDPRGGEDDSRRRRR
jgi:hypothetical protein